MAKLHMQAAKFGAVGILNTAIDWGIFNLLLLITDYKTGIMAGLFNVFGVTAASANSYFMNRSWTFSANEVEHEAQVKRFILVTLVGMVVGSVIVSQAAQLVDVIPLPAVLILNGGKLAAACFTIFFNFFAYRYWVYARPRLTQGFAEDYESGLVSIVIPAYNEEKRLPDRMEDLVKTLPALLGKFEIVLVDDGSTDRVRDVMEDYARRYPFIRAVSYDENQGKGYAVKRGMMETRGEYLIFTDADNTFDGEQIAIVARSLRQGNEVVAGKRQTDEGQRLEGESILRRFMGWGFNMMVQTLFLPGMTDTQCGLKGFSRKAAGALFTRQRLKRFAFDVELLALARYQDIEIVSVPVKGVHAEGSSVNSLLAPIQMAWDLFKLKLRFVLNTYHLSKRPPDPYDGILWASGLFVAALALRIPFIWKIPQYIDELREVSVAYKIYIGESLPLHNWALDIGALHNYILAGIFKILGPSIFAPRLYVAVTSAVTVSLAYYLGRRMFRNHWVGLMAALLLLTNGMHILVTHLAWGNCTTPFFFVLSLLATLKAEEQKSARWLAGAAFLWALTLQTNLSVIVMILAATVYVLRPSFIKATGFKWTAYLGAALAFLAGYWNMILYNFMSNRGSLVWIAKKTYAIESHPGPESYLTNLWALIVEFFRALGSVYTDIAAASSWQYLMYPTFIAAIILFFMGVRLAYKNKITKLPLYTLIAVVLIFPILNKDYTFFKSTRYILPVLICAMVYEAAALHAIYRWVTDRFAEGMARERLRAAAAVIAVLLVAAQFMPHYLYCVSLLGTDQCNSMTLHVVADIDRMSRDTDTIVLMDNRLYDEYVPVPNPFPDIFIVRNWKWRALPADKIAQAAADSSYPRVIVLLTGPTYQAIGASLNPDAVIERSCLVTLKSKFKQPGSTQYIYVLQIDHPDRAGGVTSP